MQMQIDSIMGFFIGFHFILLGPLITSCLHARSCQDPVWYNLKKKIISNGFMLSEHMKTCCGSVTLPSIFNRLFLIHNWVQECDRTSSSELQWKGHFIVFTQKKRNDRLSHALRVHSVWPKHVLPLETGHWLKQRQMYFLKISAYAWAAALIRLSAGSLTVECSGGVL